MIIQFVDQFLCSTSITQKMYQTPLKGLVWTLTQRKLSALWYIRSYVTYRRPLLKIFIGPNGMGRL